MGGGTTRKVKTGTKKPVDNPVGSPSRKYPESGKAGEAGGKWPEGDKYPDDEIGWTEPPHPVPLDPELDIDAKKRISKGVKTGR